MSLGMVCLEMPLSGLERLLGTTPSRLQADSPAVATLAMAVTMIVPMVGWMRYRGHGLEPCLEVGAAMFVPAIVLSLVATYTEMAFDSVTLVEHVVMLPSMLGGMLCKRHEYSHPPRPIQTSDLVAPTP